jgi:hypothetical protein
MLEKEQLLLNLYNTMEEKKWDVYLEGIMACIS